MKDGLTTKQAECLAAIKRLTLDGIPPTYRQLADDMGLASISGVHRMVHGLRERGHITSLPGQARSIATTREAPADERTRTELMTGLIQIGNELKRRQGVEPTARLFRDIADQLEARP